MKKLMTVILLSLCMLSLVACQKISESEVYSFPELTKKLRLFFIHKDRKLHLNLGKRIMTTIMGKLTL
jgi:uncharacterized lipoprotein YehR (DUF1307 family)